MPNSKPHIPYPNDVVAQRMARLCAEVQYRERVYADIAEPLAHALGEARRSRYQASLELGLDPSQVEGGKIFYVRGKGIFWENDEWMFDAEKEDLVRRPSVVAAEAAPAATSKKRPGKRSRRSTKKPD